MQKYKTLILDRNAVKELVSMKEAIAAIEGVFRYYGRNRVQMPSKIYLYLEKYKGDFRAMPAYVEDLDACGIKWVNVYPYL
jgi:ornithine cyclodeaminase/alanine dehydrogenase-like protein (mu-crystallin family)